jgi:hypothetical protein
MWSLTSTVWPAPLANLARLSADWAWGRLWHQARWQRSLIELFLQRPVALRADVGVQALHEATAQLAGLPFDVVRVQHAAGVLAGAWPRSLLESTRFEQRLGALEQLTLGPLARRA